MNLQQKTEFDDRQHFNRQTQIGINSNQKNILQDKLIEGYIKSEKQDSKYSKRIQEKQQLETKIRANDIDTHQEQQYEAQYDEVANHERLEIVKSRITLSGAELLDLTYDRNNSKFTKVVTTLEKQALSFILTEDFQEAVIYLSEAQRILDYSASCGKAIDIAMIISVLHNQAYLYQRMERFQDALTYLEALIFNLTGKQDQVLTESTFSSTIESKNKVFSYHLQFCAMNSEIGNHETALKAAKNSIAILQQTMEIYALLLKSHFKNSSFESTYWIKAFDPLSKIEPNLQNKNYSTYLKEAALLVQSLPKSLQKIVFSNQNQSQLSYLNAISELQSLPIQKIMQIVPTSIDKQIRESARPINQKLNYSDFLKMIVKLSVSYFSVGNELRFVSGSHYGSYKNSNQQDNYLDSQQYKLSELYHLYSIIILVLYIPCESLYLDHVLSSYTEIYGIDLRYFELKGNKQENFSQKFLSENEKVTFQLKIKGQQKNQQQKNEAVRVKESFSIKFIQLQGKTVKSLYLSSQNQSQNDKSEIQNQIQNQNYNQKQEEQSQKNSFRQNLTFIQPEIAIPMHTNRKQQLAQNEKSCQNINIRQKTQLFNLSFKKDKIYKRKVKNQKKDLKDKNKTKNQNKNNGNITNNTNANNSKKHSINGSSNKSIHANKSLYLNYLNNQSSLVKKKASSINLSQHKHKNITRNKSATYNSNQKTNLILFQNSRLNGNKNKSFHKTSNSKSRQVRKTPAKSNQLKQAQHQHPYIQKFKSKDRSKSRKRLQGRKSSSKMKNNSESCKIIMRKVKGPQNKQIILFHDNGNSQNNQNATNRSQSMTRLKVNRQRQMKQRDPQEISKRMKSPKLKSRNSREKNTKSSKKIAVKIDIKKIEQKKS